MADENRIVFPDEVEEIKAKAVEEQQCTKKEEDNEVQQPVEVEAASGVQMRNVIVTPPNCPPGFVRGADGVCREVF